MVIFLNIITFVIIVSFIIIIIDYFILLITQRFSANILTTICSEE